MIDVTDDLYHTAPLEDGHVLLSDAVHWELRIEAQLRVGGVRAARSDRTITPGFVYRQLLEKFIWQWAMEASVAFCTSDRDIRLRQEGMFRFLVGRFPDRATLFQGGVYRGVLASNELSISHATPPVA